MNPYSIHKFGGSCLSHPSKFPVIKALVSGKNEIIIVSALQGVTNRLVQSLEKAKSGFCYQQELEDVMEKHLSLFQALKLSFLQDILERDFAIISDLLKAVRWMHAYAQETYDLLLGFGELWSAQIMQAYLSQSNDVAYLDAGAVLVIEEQEGVIVIDWKRSKALIEQHLAELCFDQLVIPGFIAATKAGQRATLGRNGSDFSAAIFAHLFDAQSLTLWKDVEGIYNADPKHIASAALIESLSYEEALELAYFGARVLHPKTIAPLAEKAIPLYIKNMNNPKAKGSYISAQSDPGVLVKGISSIEKIALINIEGTGFISVSALSSRVCARLHQVKVPILLMTQASSEYSLCLGVHQADLNKALNALDKELEQEIRARQIACIRSEVACSILSIVGDGMKGCIGVTEKLARALTRAKINIHAISQGSSERSISVVIQESMHNKALQVMHAEFYLSRKTLSVGLIGPGLVGKRLLAQIQNVLVSLKEQYQIHICLRGIMNSQKMILAHHALDLTSWEHQWSQQAVASNLEQFVAHVANDYFPNAVIIDCTANPMIAGQYGHFFDQGIHVVTPNKHANAGDFDYYKSLKKSSMMNPYYFYEATVCAGLPVISTLQDLLKTGDEIEAIEGVVSGTLSYIFNQIALGKTFSEAVVQAKNQGFTEPDPREDLSGMDVARKLVCLAREWGQVVHLEEVAVHNLVPEDLRSCSINDFLERLPAYDAQFNMLQEEALSKHARLHYMGAIHKNGKITVRIKGLPLTHPFSQLSGADNMLIFKTKRYNERPLIIQGPGAGAEVTAAGVFADLLRLVSIIV